MMQKIIKTWICFTLLVVLSAAISISAANAVVFHLRAETMTMTMPDAAVVTMWGFALDTDGDFTTIENSPTSPGPQLEVPVGDNTLTIIVQNNLTVPISLVIPGQIAVMLPVKIADAQGRDRVRSFTAETAPGTAGTYTWNNFKPGTYLYQSGTDPSVQVQMGLYGAAFRDTGIGQAYSNAATFYNWQGILVLSEIDPVLHAAVAADDYGPGKAVTSTIDYDSKYFLYNGNPDPAAITIDAAAIPTGQRILVRLLNAGLETRIPLVNGLYMRKLAEDGNLLPYLYEKYSLVLLAGKTMDVMLTTTTPGPISFLDRRGMVSNGGSGSGQLTITEGAVPPGGGGGGGGGSGCFISTL